jgi:hypothetical protein
MIDGSDKAAVLTLDAVRLKTGRTSTVVIAAAGCGDTRAPIFNRPDGVPRPSLPGECSAEGIHITTRGINILPIVPTVLAA